MTYAAKVSNRVGLFYGWLIVMVGGTMTAVAGGTFYFGFSAVFDPIIREFGWSRAATSVAYSIRAEVGGLEAPLVGVLLDRFGPRRVMRAGIVILSLGMFIIAATQNIWMFYFGFTVATIGMGACGGLAGMLAITRWFDRRRGRALAIMTIGNGLGGLMVPVLAVLIVNFGWRAALVAAGFYIMLIGLPLTFIMVDRPEQMGLNPDGISEDEKAAQAANDTSDSDDGGNEAKPEDVTLSGKQAIKTRSFWILAFALVFISLSGAAITVHLVPHFIHVGMPDELAALGMTALATISLVGRVGFGFAADKYDKRYVMAAAMGMQALGCAGLALVQGPISALLVLAVLSPGFGGSVPVRPALQADYFGVNSFGAVQGFLMLVSTLGGAVGPVLAGWMFDQSDSYQAAWLVLGVISLVGVPLILILQRPKSVSARKSPQLPVAH